MKALCDCKCYKLTLWSSNCSRTAHSYPNVGKCKVPTGPSKERAHCQWQEEKKTSGQNLGSLAVATVQWHNVQSAAIIKHRQWTIMTMSQIDSTFWNAKVKRRLLSGNYSRTVRPTKSQHLCCHGIKSSGRCLRVHSACYDNDKLVHMVVVEIESMLGTLHRYHPCGSVQTWKGKPLKTRKAVRCSIFRMNFQKEMISANLVAKSPCFDALVTMHHPCEVECWWWN